MCALLKEIRKKTNKMPPVRNGPFMNLDDRRKNAIDDTSSTNSSRSLHDNHHSMIDSNIPMHSHLTMQSHVNASMAISSKQYNQYETSMPAMIPQQHQPHSSGPSSHQSNQQNAPLTKAELRKVNSCEILCSSLVYRVQEICLKFQSGSYTRNRCFFFCFQQTRFRLYK